MADFGDLALLGKIGHEYEIIGVDAQLRELNTKVSSLKAAPVSLKLDTTEVDAGLKRVREGAVAANAADEQVTRARRSRRTEEERAEKQAHQEGMERLRNASATAVLNARLAADAEKVAALAVRKAYQERQEQIELVRLAHARARAEFDKEAGQAKSYGEKTLAAQKYRQAIREIEEGLNALGRRGEMTTRQLTAIAQVQQRLAREQTTLGGGINVLGLSGNVSNALQANLPRIITGLQNSLSALSPSLGAAAMNSGLLNGALGGMATMGGPAGVALGVVTVATTALAAGIVSSVNAYADLEKALNGLKATSGANAQEMKTLQTAAENTARQYGLLTREVVAAQEELAKGGIATAEIGGATEAVTVLAKATGTTLAQAVATAIPVMNVWNLTGAQMMQVADVISNGANKSALDVAGLSMSLQQAAGAAESAGFSFEETVAVLALLADRGIQGSDAGTSMRVMLERLRAPTKDTTAALSQYNVAVFDSQGRQRDMVTVLGEVIRAMDKMTDEQRAAFAQTVFGTDAQRSITAAYKSGKTTLDEYITSMSAVGTAQSNAATRLNGLRGAQDKFNSSLDLFKTKVGEYFAPAMTTLITTATDGIEKLNTLFDYLKRIRSERDALQNSAAQDALAGKEQELAVAETNLRDLRTLRTRQQDAGMTPNENLIGKIDAAYARVQELRTQVEEAAARARRDQVERDQEAARTARADPRFQGPVQGAGPSYIQPLTQQLGVGKFVVSQEFGENPNKLGYDGRGHRGIDVATPKGTEIRAAFDATVYAGFDKDGYGKYVKLIDDKGQALILAHLDSLDAALQKEIKLYGTAKVKAGTLLARSGNTGNSTNPHLHLEGRTVNGLAVDPRTLTYANTSARPQLGGGG